MGNLKLAQVGDGLPDDNADCPEVSVLPENDGDERVIAGLTNRRIVDVIALTGDNLGRLITLYHSRDEFVDGGAKLQIEASLKRKLSSLLAEDSTMSHEILTSLVFLSKDPINEDGCVTNVLHGACRDFDTAMYLWEFFTSRHDEVDSRSDEFLRKHLDTYNGDESALWKVYGKFNRGSRRAKFIASFIDDMRCRRQLNDLDGSRGDYGKLVEFDRQSSTYGSSVGGKLAAFVRELLPSMIDTCDGDFDRLIELYSKPLCRRPLVAEAIETALVPEIEKCGDDFGKLADLRSKIPSDFHGVIEKAVVELCRKDPINFYNLIRSSLAEPFCRFVVLNLSILEEGDQLDLDVTESLLKLRKTVVAKNDSVVGILLKNRIKASMDVYADVFKQNFDLILRVYKMTGDDDEYGKIISPAVKESVPIVVDQCAGDFTELTSLYDKVPSEIRGEVDDFFIEAFGKSGESLAVYCDYDMKKLCAVKKPAQASYALGESINGAVKEAMKAVLKSIISECGGFLDELCQLYENNRGNYDLFAYGSEQREAAREVFGLAIENLMSSLVSECEGDVNKLAALYDVIPFDFKYNSSGSAVLKAVRDLPDPFGDRYPDDLGELAILHESIPYQFRAELSGKIEEKVRDLLPFAVEQCNGDVGELTRLHKETLRCNFSKELNRVVMLSIQVFIDGCCGDFAKKVALYNMLSEEGQKAMSALLEVK